MANLEDKNYLTGENQENDIPANNSNPISETTIISNSESSDEDEDLMSCDEDSKEYKNRHDNGQNFPRQDELYEAITNMKNTIYMDYFQLGPSEKVHDTALLNKYLNLIGSIWQMIAHGSIEQPKALFDQQNDNIKGAIRTFLGQLNEHLQLPDNNSVDNEMRTLFLKLHLHCYPYCLNEKCLSNDV
jgi:hypothetical protein